ncbi:hypothetical protein H480_25328 [Amycolatopsis vancoresmycina DSM 44592]|uniref:Uncharacterized protein n=1 Tax=Amycolatopsis vancoresmycina DSM 44592 TaxID=1292037 RepID=R1G2J1_9PSEU|nr:hypothetical protein H480_25328 [Amycolatopsis vancoresmycina DSM 44592]
MHSRKRVHTDGEPTAGGIVAAARRELSSRVAETGSPARTPVIRFAFTGGREALFRIVSLFVPRVCAAATGGASASASDRVTRDVGKAEPLPAPARRKERSRERR